MKTTNAPSAIDELIGRVGECLTPELARRLLVMKADRKLQTHIDNLAERYRKGLLTCGEEAEYGNLVRFSTFVAIIKSKARQLLRNGDSAK